MIKIIYEVAFTNERRNKKIIFFKRLLIMECPKLNEPENAKILDSKNYKAWEEGSIG
jgi:hypothetical protein